VNPLKKLFLIDGLGALISAFLLGVVLVHFQALVGIPRSTLYFLAFLPCLFAVYDFIVYVKVRTGLAAFLKIIAVVNILYCVLSIGLAIWHRDQITALGWAYVIGEVILVAALAVYEWRVAATRPSD